MLLTLYAGVQEVGWYCCVLLSGERRMGRGVVVVGSRRVKVDMLGGGYGGSKL